MCGSGKISCLWILLLSLYSGGQSIIVCEALGGKILYESHAQKQRPVASLTKIATGVVAIDWAKNSGKGLRFQVVVPSSVVGLGGGNPMSLQPGDVLTLKDALTSMLVGSDNYAAETVAANVGRELALKRGEKVPGKEEFIREMNALARMIGMSQTYFANAHGMDTAMERGHSSAVDLVKLCQYALKKREFSAMVSLRSAKVTRARAGKAQSYFPKNTNILLGKDGFLGVKTGMTGLAGGCLASYCVRQQGGKFITIVLGASDRFGLTQAVVNQAEVTYARWVRAGRPLQDVKRECVRAFY